ncbi:hypothetical protein BST81_00520 [Leptolyngbya sp. 'hensonii']|uniref:hypothetical protein n=1 Tax=Leptolyngbya sp. 'hensonii' TaxID=1922337 RepID=UPI0009501CDA|nr:hypothetical protein [Leptolyngbya sp. 'hensonii']OLP20262.1 hypothetical protein BST81_00520 [Leptolyngbya sp. 'hensonii']
MNNSPFENLTKKDLIASFKIWLMMELTGFVIFPVLRLIQNLEKLQNWFLISLPLGIGGMLLIAASSQFISTVSERHANRTDKGLSILVGQVGGWVGSAGIMFPLIVVVSQFLTEVSSQVGKVK